MQWSLVVGMIKVMKNSKKLVCAKQISNGNRWGDFIF